MITPQDCLDDGYVVQFQGKAPLRRVGNGGYEFYQRNAWQPVRGVGWGFIEAYVGRGIPWRILTLDFRVVDLDTWSAARAGDRAKQEQLSEADLPSAWSAVSP